VARRVICTTMKTSGSTRSKEITSLRSAPSVST
jgi:hypothetical protein